MQYVKNQAKTKQPFLEDMRDGKKYWVAKLHDGNCWMTQNLDYDGYGARRDAPAQWVGSAKSYDSETLYPNVAEYYDPGFYVFDYRNGASCDTGSTGDINECLEKGWTNVDGWTALKEATRTYVVDLETRTYDAHYLVGNLYSFESASNGTASQIAIYPGNAAGSICPLNWRLPSGGNDGEWATLTADITSATGRQLLEPPYYMVPSGVVSKTTGESEGKYSSLGSWGQYTSSSAYSKNGVNYLGFSPSYPINGDYVALWRDLGNPRTSGRSVRCIAE